MGEIPGQELVNFVVEVHYAYCSGIVQYCSVGFRWTFARMQGCAAHRADGLYFWHARTSPNLVTERWSRGVTLVLAST